MDLEKTAILLTRENLSSIQPSMDSAKYNSSKYYSETDDDDDDLEDLQDLAEKKEIEQREYRAMISMIQHARVSDYFAWMANFFQQPLGKIALLTTPEKKFLMDKYLPIDIIKMFNGIEIHNLNKAFSKFRNEVSLEVFIVIGFRILDTPKEDGPYVLQGLIDLYNSLTTKKGKKDLNFKDFLNNFIKIQSMFSEHKGYINEENKTIRFALSNNQDFSHHQNSIKNAHYSKSLKIIFSLDEGSDCIRMFSPSAEAKGKIQADKKNHARRSVVMFSDFAWSEKQKKIAACSQDFISFFTTEDKFSVEHCYPTDTMHTSIWFIDFCDYWYSTDTRHALFSWDENLKMSSTLVKVGATIACVTGLPNLGLIAVASFDKRVIFYNPFKHTTFLTINMEVCSAHTLKFSREHNIFFAATFGQNITVYQIHESREFSRIAQVEHPATTTAIELFEEHNVIITCDDEGNLKSWDCQNFKALQHYILNTNFPISKILSLEGQNKFCVVTNRLNFFDLGQVVTTNEKNHQVVPIIRYNSEKEEIVVALSNDIRVFSIRYGILSELYDKDLYNIDESRKIVNFKKSSKTDHSFFVDQKGLVKQLTVFTNKEAKKGFQPFKTDNFNLIYDEQYNLLVTWFKNSLMIYRYEISTNMNLLLRSIKLPEKYLITAVKVYKSKQLLAMVLNYSIVVFWGFHKFDVCGAFMNFDESLLVDSEEGLSNPAIRWDSKLSLRSSLHFASPNKDFSPSRVDASPFRKKDSIEVKFNFRAKTLESKLRSIVEGAVADTKSSTSQVQNPASEILNIFYVDEYNCFLLLDGKYDLHLIGQKGFEEFNCKVKLNLEVKKKPADYAYIKVKLKVIDFKPLIENKALNVQDIADIYVNSTSYHNGRDLQYLLVMCNTNLEIVILNLNNVLHKYFKSQTNDSRAKQPFYTTQVEFTEVNMKNILDLAQNNSKQNLDIKNFNIPLSKQYSWKTGKVPILNVKPVVFNTVLLITLNQNASLKIWNLKGEIVGHLNIKDTKRKIWQINQYNELQRVEVFQKTQEIFQGLFKKYEKEISKGCHDNIDAKFEERIKIEYLKEMNPPPQGAKKRPIVYGKTPKNSTQETPLAEKSASSKAVYVLERDHQLFAKNRDEYDFIHFERKTPSINQIPEKPTAPKEGSAHPYIRVLDKKLEDTVDHHADNHDEFSQRVTKSRSTATLKLYNKDARNSRLNKRGSEEFAALFNEAGSIVLKSPKEKSPIYRPGTKSKEPKRKPQASRDYLQVYDETCEVPSHQNSVSLGRYASEPKFTPAQRSAKRTYFFKDLDKRTKNIQNLAGKANVRENLVNISEVLTYDEKEKRSKNRHYSNKSSLLPNFGNDDSIIHQKKHSKLYQLPSLTNLSKPLEDPAAVMNLTINKRYFEETKNLKGNILKSVLQKKHANNRTLPILQYDPKLDQEIIKNLESLEQVTKSVSNNIRNESIKKAFENVSKDIDSIKHSRSLSLNKYYFQHHKNS